MKLQADFKKKKVKVGKTLIKNNVTKVNVKSKKLLIPSQNLTGLKDISSHRELLEKIGRQLNHYSTSAKVNAFENCKSFMLSNDPNVYVGSIVPTALEILFDEDRDSRKALNDFMGCILRSSKASSFESIINTIITFTCNGLTTLHKGVRKDSLSLMELLSDYIPALILPYINKIIEILLAVLNDNISNAGPQSFLQLSTKQSIKGVNNQKNQKADKNKLSNTLTTLLRVISKLFASARKSTKTIVRCGLWRDVVDNSCNDLVRWDIPLMHPTSSILVLNHHRGVINDEVIVSDKLISELTEKLCRIWDDLVLDDESLATDVIETLQDLIVTISNIYNSSKQLSDFFPETIRRVFMSLTRSFPYVSREYLIAAADSDKSKSSKVIIDKLNISICDLILTYSNQARLSETSINVSTKSMVDDSKLPDNLFELMFEFILDSIEDVSISLSSSNHPVRTADISSNDDKLEDAISDDDLHADPMETSVTIHQSNKKSSRHLDNGSSSLETLFKVFHSVEILLNSVVSTKDAQSEFVSIQIDKLKRIVESIRKLTKIIFNDDNIVQGKIHISRQDRSVVKAIINTIHTFCLTSDNLWRSYHSISCYPEEALSLGSLLDIFHDLIDVFQDLCPVLSDDHFKIEHPVKMLSYQSMILQAITAILQRIDVDVLLLCKSHESMKRLCQNVMMSMNIDRLTVTPSENLSISANVLNAEILSIVEAKAYLHMDLYYYGYFEDLNHVSRYILSQIIQSGDVQLLDHFFQLLIEREPDLTRTSIVSIVFEGMNEVINLSSSTVGKCTIALLRFMNTNLESYAEWMRILNEEGNVVFDVWQYIDASALLVMNLFDNVDGSLFDNIKIYLDWCDTFIENKGISIESNDDQTVYFKTSLRRFSANAILSSYIRLINIHQPTEHYGQYIENIDLVTEKTVALLVESSCTLRHTSVCFQDIRNALINTANTKSEEESQRYVISSKLNVISTTEDFIDRWTNRLLKVYSVEGANSKFFLDFFNSYHHRVSSIIDEELYDALWGLNVVVGEISQSIISRSSSISNAIRDLLDVAVARSNQNERTLEIITEIKRHLVLDYAALSS